MTSIALLLRDIAEIGSAPQIAESDGQPDSREEPDFFLRPLEVARLQE